MAHFDYNFFDGRGPGATGIQTVHKGGPNNCGDCYNYTNSYTGYQNKVTGNTAYNNCNGDGKCNYGGEGNGDGK